MAKKKKISKSSKRRLALFGTISIVIIFYFIFSSGYYVYKIYKLKQEEIRLSNKLNELQKEEKQLSNDMEKLKDPDYLAKYARETYSYSKDDELIIQKIEEEKKEEEKKELKFNEKDILIVSICIGVVFLIIIYIFVKSNKKKGK